MWKRRLRRSRQLTNNPAVNQPFFPGTPSNPGEFCPGSFRSTATLIRLFVVLLLLPVYSQASEPYQIHPLSERQMLETYTQLLREACTYAERDWKSSSFSPEAGFWGDGASSGNQGIRTIASMVLACGTLLKYDPELTEAERSNLLTKATAALRFATATHVTGTQKCPDGKSWGATRNFGAGSWQSGMWTGTLAFGAWLIWEKLEPSLQQSIERVIASEDDVLAARKPPNNLWLDTKAEENAWEVPCLVLGELMFPAHPHAAAWHETALKYMMNTLCTADDLQSTNQVDGRAVNQWVGGPNLQPDFTLENHNIFHPAYVACSCYFLTQAALYYTYANRPVPQAARHHLPDTWRMFRTIILPWGEAAYPQGMDWELHSLPYLNLFASLGTHDQDPFAARMEQCSLQYVRAWQKMDQGSLAFPGSQLGITRHAINAEQAAYAFLAHKIFGASVNPISSEAAAAQEQGVRIYPHVEFVAHRTEQKFVSFSWKNRVMGMLIPLGSSHENNPDFTVPIQNGLVGSFELSPRGDVRTEVLKHSWKQTPDGFETAGTLSLNGGRLKQKLRVVSLGNRTVVYEDQVTAVSNVTVRLERGVPLGIENDEITGGTRVLSGQDRETQFDWRKPQPPVALHGAWANVDGRIGVVMLAGSGITYAQASDYSRGIAVRAGILYGSSCQQSRQFKLGQQVAHRLAIVVVEVTPGQTAALAQSCRIEEGPQGRVLHFMTLEGKELVLPLL